MRLPSIVIQESRYRLIMLVAVMTHLLLHACAAPQDNKIAPVEPVPLLSVTAPAPVAVTHVSTLIPKSKELIFVEFFSIT